MGGSVWIVLDRLAAPPCFLVVKRSTPRQSIGREYVCFVKEEETMVQGLDKCNVKETERYRRVRASRSGRAEDDRDSNKEDGTVAEHCLCLKSRFS
jgi:hypothetical protein